MRLMVWDFMTLLRCPADFKPLSRVPSLSATFNSAKPSRSTGEQTRLTSRAVIFSTGSITRSITTLLPGTQQAAGLEQHLYDSVEVTFSTVNFGWEGSMQANYRLSLLRTGTPLFLQV